MVTEVALVEQSNALSLAFHSAVALQKPAE